MSANKERFFFLSASYTKDPLLPQPEHVGQRSGQLVLGKPRGFGGVLQGGEGICQGLPRKGDYGMRRAEHRCVVAHAELEQNQRGAQH